MDSPMEELVEQQLSVDRPRPGETQEGDRIPADRCQLCGSTPAADVVLRRVTGMLIMGRRERVEGPLCRDCGTALFRDMTNRTLLFGWWGIRSFFANWLAIAGNVAASRKIRRLAAPVLDGSVPLPLPAPLDPGRPLSQRAGLWGVTGLVALVVVGGVLSPGTGPDLEDEAPRDLVGSCVAYDGSRLDDVVPCDVEHDGIIIDVVRDAESCPSTTDAVFGRNDRAWSLCIDEDVA